MLLTQTRSNPVGPEGLGLAGEGVPQGVREGVAGALGPVHVHQLWASVPATPGLRRDSSPPAEWQGRPSGTTPRTRVLRSEWSFVACWATLTVGSEPGAGQR